MENGEPLSCECYRTHIFPAPLSCRLSLSLIFFSHSSLGPDEAFLGEDLGGSVVWLKTPPFQVFQLRHALSVLTLKIFVSFPNLLT